MPILVATLLAMATPAAASPPILLPNYTILSQPEFPNGTPQPDMGGTVRFELAIGANGKPTKCTIVKPSAVPGFDRNTCSDAMVELRFAPARDVDGRPVPGTLRISQTLTKGTGPKPDQTGHAVVVTFDGGGEVQSCAVQPLANTRTVTPDQQQLCARMGDTLHFRALLGRPTQGLAMAALRFLKFDPMAQPAMQKPGQFRRQLARVDFDMLDDGRITWCDVTTPPVSPLLGLKADALCGPGQFGPTAPPSGGYARVFIVDVAATLAPGSTTPP